MKGEYETIVNVGKLVGSNTIVVAHQICSMMSDFGTSSDHSIPAKMLPADM